MPSSRVPPWLESLLSRGGTRPLFGSRALWSCWLLTSGSARRPRDRVAAIGRRLLRL